MANSKRHLNRSTLERLLVSTGQRIVYPDTPDVTPKLRARTNASPSAQIDSLSRQSAMGSDARQDLGSSGTGSGASVLDEAAPRRHEIAKLVAGLTVFAIAASVLAVVFGYSGWLSVDDTPRSVGNDPGESAAATATALGESSFVVPLTPEPGWEVETAAIGQRMDNGDVRIHIEAEGPESQLPESQVNVMWTVATGSCYKEQHEVLRWTDPSKVLLRWNWDIIRPGYRAVTLVLEREWLTQSLWIGAFEVGGGPLVACGDVPTTGTGD